MWAAFIFNGKNFNQSRNQRYLGIRIPEEYLNNPQVKKLIEAYGKDYSRWFYLSGGATFFILFLSKSFSILYVYFTLYMFLVPASQIYLMYKYQEAMKKVKYSLGWGKSEGRLVYVDTKLSAEYKTERKPIFIWMMISFLLSFYPFVSGEAYLNSLKTIFVILSIVTWSIGLFIIYKINQSRAKVYSEDHETNLRLNKVIQNRWIYGVVWMVIFQVLVNNYLYYLIISQSSGFKIALHMAFMSVSILLIFYYIYKSNETMLNKSADRNKLQVLDEEDYWFAGMFYCNPNNSRLLVSDKTGMHTTFNLGIKSGKILMVGILVLFVVVMVSSCGFIVLEEQLQPSVTFNRGSIEFSAIIYKDQIDYDQIRSVFLVDALEDGYKVNGSATDTYARGSFNFSEYGPSRLYIFKDSRPYLAIETQDHYYFYSGKDKEDTYRIYNQLLDKTK